ncbi:efflux RND transporter periplasmic adaptor subunit [Teredinibacter haidensis]|uniref:efflux RND transporter periplasmic adaptor subunit n=1 Tax=Teredinibacter haidensis TaxID=2731755 RepID=UPI0009FB9075|nr:hypothetical protein [Teredinibacter haidensis]
MGSPIATVYDSTGVEIRLPLTESQAALVHLPFIKPQKRDSGYTNPSVIVRGSVAGEQREWRGSLVRTDAFVDSNSRMYYAVVEITNPFDVQTTGSDINVPLLPGLFVEAEIEGKELDDVLALPRGALFERDKLISLDSENKVAVQNVRVLRRSEKTVWVQTDLEEDTLVSVEKQSLTPAGSTVEPLLENYGAEQPVATITPTDKKKE